MSFTHRRSSGAAADGRRPHRPRLVRDLVASGITAQDAEPLGPRGRGRGRRSVSAGPRRSPSPARSSPRSTPCATQLEADGVTPHRARRHGRLVARPRGHHAHRTASSSPCSTRPSPGRCAPRSATGSQASALVISSKSGSTVETDSQRRVYEQAFRDAGIDPPTRIIVVTDPGSPLDESARAAGYRVFNADPNVGGRYSALTAFGLVPSGLAGVDIAEMLDEAETIELALAHRQPREPRPRARRRDRRRRRRCADKLAIVADGTHIVGFADWAEQLIAESTGKQGTGILPVVLDVDAPELTADLPDLQVVRLVDDAGDQIFSHHDTGEIRVSGTPRRAAARLGVRDGGRRTPPRHQPVRPARRRVGEDRRARPARRPPRARRPRRSSRTASRCAARPRSSAHRATSTRRSTCCSRSCPANGYISVQAYVDRVAHPELAELRDLLAARAGRPVTFGWGPRFLHSTGQFHKGGPAVGVFLQITQTPARTSRSPTARSPSASSSQAQAVR